MLRFLALVAILPWLSPPRFKVDPFRNTFNYVMVILIAMAGYIQAVTLAAAKDPGSPRARWLVGGIFLFFALIGNVLGKARRPSIRWCCGGASSGVRGSAKDRCDRRPQPCSRSLRSRSMIR